MHSAPQRRQYGNATPTVTCTPPSTLDFRTSEVGVTVTELVMTVFGGRSALSGTGSLAQLTLVPLDPTQPLGRDNAVVLTRSEARAHMADTRGLHQYPAAWVCAVRTALACGSPSSLPPVLTDGVAGVLHRFAAAYGGLPAAWTERLETALPELVVQ